MPAQQVVDFTDGPWAGRQGLVAAPLPGVVRPAGAKLTFLGETDPPVQTKFCYRWDEENDLYRLEVKP